MKTVFISGGTRGIGLKTAYEFKKQGYNVVIAYFSNDEAAQKLEKEIGALCLKCDVSVEGEVLQAVNKTHAHFGKIDVLVNNAGIAPKQKVFCDVELKEFDRVFDVNVKGMFLLAKAFLSDLIDTQGKIINVSSIWGIDGGSCEVLYSMTKAAVIGLTKSLAKELAPSKIRVNAVAPGFIDTDMNAHLDKDEVEAFCENVGLSRVGQADEVAKVIYFLASENSSYMTGEVLRVDGGM